MPSRKNHPHPIDLGALIEGLVDAGVEFIIVGGIAAVSQGVPITTFDLDIVHRRTDDNIDNLMAFLRSVNAIQRRPDENVIVPDARHLKTDGRQLLTTRYGPLDVLSVIEGNRDYDLLLPHSVAISFKGRRVKVLRLEAMIELKRQSGNAEDQRRLPILIETARQLENRPGDD